MKFVIWLDDIRPIPAMYSQDHWVALNSVNQAKNWVERVLENVITPEDEVVFDLDHDLGDFYGDGGDAYKFVEWLIATGRNIPQYKILCHSMNPVGKSHILGLYERYWR